MDAYVEKVFIAENRLGNRILHLNIFKKEGEILCTLGKNDEDRIVHFSRPTKKISLFKCLLFHKEKTL